MKDFPVSPSASVFGAFKDGLLNLFGAETDPFAPMMRFGELSFNTAGIVANAGAVAAYAEAMKDFPVSPSASVFGAFKTGLLNLFGGETDPFAPMKDFGELSFNTAGIVANAGAVAAYAEAMKDFPASPSASVFTSLKDGIVGLLGGETDPFAPMKRFGELTFNSTGISANAGAVSAFAAAMADMPAVDAERSGGVLGAIGKWFSGEAKMPWDSVKAFAEADLGDPAAIKANSTALSAFSTAFGGATGLSTVQDFDPGELDELPAILKEFSELNGGGLTGVANGMTAIANVNGLQSNLDILNAGLDVDGVKNYSEAIENLVEALEKMNDELSKDNNGYMPGTGTNAGDVIGSATSGSGPDAQQLNTTMQQVLLILTEMRDLDIGVERNTRNIIGSNLAQGGVSNVAR